MSLLGFSIGCAIGLAACGTGSSDPASSSFALTVPALLSIDSPPAGTYITTGNYMAFTVGGTCGYNGGTVTLQTTFPIMGTTTCAGNAWSITLDVSFIFDGNLTFVANHTGPLGEVAPSVSQDYWKDTLSPTNESIIIGDGMTIPTSPNVILNLSAMGASRMYVTNSPDCATGGVEEPFSITKNWTLQAIGSSATVYAIFSDDAGNTSTCVTATTAVNFPPTPTIAITVPAPGTYVTSANQAAFAISGTCSESGQSVMISGAVNTTALCNTGVWSAALNLTAVPDGSVTIHADLKNLDNVSAPTASISLIKDATGPAGTIAIDNGSNSTNTTSVVLTLSSPDATDMYVTNQAGCMTGGAFEPFAMTKNWVLAQTTGTATVYVAFRDARGNVGTCVSDSIAVNTSTIPALAISPSAISISSGYSQTVGFSASGGTGIYTFSIVSGAGSIVAQTGLYTAPAGANGMTLIRVTDSAMATADAVVTHLASGTMPDHCFNLQLIGMKPKNGSFSDSHRRSIFLPMNDRANLSLHDGEFRVIDANGTDGTVSFSLPNPDPAATGTLAYRVYARMVGKPGGAVDMKNCARDPLDPTAVYCDQGHLNMSRIAGSSRFEDVSEKLLSLFADLDGDGVAESVPVFDSRLQGYYWDIDSLNRPHVQLRFCLGTMSEKDDHDEHKDSDDDHL